jgi:hypothetical protein
MDLFKNHLHLSSLLKREEFEMLDQIAFAQCETSSEKIRCTQIKKFNSLLKSKKTIKKATKTPQKDVRSVINMSSYTLSDDQKNVLSKGLNFSVAPKEIKAEEFLSAIEHSLFLSKLNSCQKENVRRQTTEILLETKAPKPNLTQQEWLVLLQLKKEKSITVMRADKGNTTVIMDKQDYIRKGEEMLKEEDTYEELSEDPTSKVERKVNKAIEKNIKDRSLASELKVGVGNSNIPRIYFLPKIHKDGIPMRPIVNTIVSATYGLAAYLSGVMKDARLEIPSQVKNSSQLVEELKNFKLDAGDLLVSFDVKSLFTRVPVEEVITLVEKKFGKEIAELTNVCLNNTVFLFNGKMYKQVEGAPMGSPISPIAADIYLDKFEREALEKAEKKPKMWRRYVDDILAVWQHGEEEIQKILLHLNAQEPKIQFTIEMEKEGSLPFLDVLLKKKEDGFLSFSVYRKETHTDEYLILCCVRCTLHTSKAIYFIPL